jgi:hypothetical protein
MNGDFITGQRQAQGLHAAEASTPRDRILLGRSVQLALTP